MVPTFIPLQDSASERLPQITTPDDGVNQPNLKYQVCHVLDGALSVKHQAYDSVTEVPLLVVVCRSGQANSTI